MTYYYINIFHCTTDKVLVVFIVQIMHWSSWFVIMTMKYGFIYIVRFFCRHRCNKKTEEKHCKFICKAITLKRSIKLIANKQKPWQIHVDHFLWCWISKIRRIFSWSKHFHNYLFCWFSDIHTNLQWST